MRNDARPIGHDSPPSPVGGPDDQPPDRRDPQEPASRTRQSRVVNVDKEPDDRERPRRDDVADL